MRQLDGFLEDSGVNIVLGIRENYQVVGIEYYCGILVRLRFVIRLDLLVGFPQLLLLGFPLYFLQGFSKEAYLRFPQESLIWFPQHFFQNSSGSLL